MIKGAQCKRISKLETESQIADWRAVQAKLAELRKKGAEYEDSEAQDALARAESIARDYQAKAAPFEHVIAQFDDQIQAINVTFRPENAALWKKRYDLIDSCDARSAAVRHERDAQLEPLKRRGWDIVNRKHAAVGALQLAVVDANFEVFALMPPHRAQ